MKRRTILRAAACTALVVVGGLAISYVSRPMCVPRPSVSDNLEMHGLATTLAAFHEQKKVYPPGEQLDDLRSVVKEVFPRYEGDLVADLKAAGLDVADLDARETLVFWLGGLSHEGRPVGFHMDPKHPFQSPLVDGGRNRTTPLFDFAEQRFSDSDADGWLEYQSRLSVPGSPVWFTYDARTHRVVRFPKTDRVAEADRLIEGL